jgi:hypothetical protein
MARRRKKVRRRNSMRGANVPQGSASDVGSANVPQGSASDVRSANVPSGRRVRGIRGASQGQMRGANTEAATGQQAAQQRQLTPFFEGANAFDPEIGYFRVAPGQNPQEVLETLKREKGMAPNRSRRVTIGE